MRDPGLGQKGRGRGENKSLTREKEQELEDGGQGNEETVKKRKRIYGN